MKIEFLKDQQDIRPNRPKIILKGTILTVTSELGSKYIEMGVAKRIDIPTQTEINKRGRKIPVISPFIDWFTILNVGNKMTFIFGCLTVSSAIIIGVLQLQKTNTQSNGLVNISELNSLKQVTITGELYFKLIDFSSLYGLPDSATQVFEHYFDSLAVTPKLSEKDSQLTASFQLLKKYELLNNPTSHLRLDSTAIVTVYLTEGDYERLKQYDRQELVNGNQKVEVSMSGKYLSNNLFRCDKILSTDKTDGKTYWRK